MDFKCHHARSWLYYAESVASKYPTFDAVQCNNYDEFKNLNCNRDTPPSNMGYHADVDCSGIYYLQTNPKFPFSRNVFGIQYYPAIDSDRLVEEINNSE